MVFRLVMAEGEAVKGFGSQLGAANICLLEEVEGFGDPALGVGLASAIKEEQTVQGSYLHGRRKIGPSFRRPSEPVESHASSITGAARLHAQFDGPGEILDRSPEAP